VSRFIGGLAVAFIGLMISMAAGLAAGFSTDSPGAWSDWDMAFVLIFMLAGFGGVFWGLVRMGTALGIPRLLPRRDSRAWMVGSLVAWAIAGYLAGGWGVRLVAAGFGVSEPSLAYAALTGGGVGAIVVTMYTYRRRRPGVAAEPTTVATRPDNGSSGSR